MPFHILTLIIQRRSIIRCVRFSIRAERRPRIEPPVNSSDYAKHCNQAGVSSHEHSRRDVVMSHPIMHNSHYGGHHCTRRHHNRLLYALDLPVVFTPEDHCVRRILNRHRKSHAQPEGAACEKHESMNVRTHLLVKLKRPRTVHFFILELSGLVPHTYRMLMCGILSSHLLAYQDFVRHQMFELSATLISPSLDEAFLLWNMQRWAVNVVQCDASRCRDVAATTRAGSSSRRSSCSCTFSCLQYKLQY